MMEIRDKLFKLSNKGIHFIRNGYTYRQVSFSDIITVKLYKGKSVRNWQIIMFLGVIFILLAVTLSVYLFSSIFIKEQPVRFYNLLGHGILIVLILFAMGLFSIINSIKNVPIFFIETGENRFKLRVIKNQRNIEKLIEFFEKNGVKINRCNRN